MVLLAEAPQDGSLAEIFNRPLSNGELGTCASRGPAIRPIDIEGIDPIDARNAFKHALTVRTLGESYIKRHAKPKKRSWEEDERKLKKEVYPVLGSFRAEDVGLPHGTIPGSKLEPGRVRRQDRVWCWRAIAEG